MTMPFTDQDRARVARGWRSSGLSQPIYAAEHGITDRTLRDWISRWAPVPPGGAVVARKVILQAIERLQSVLGGLDMSVAQGTEAPPGKPTRVDELQAVLSRPFQVGSPPSGQASGPVVITTHTLAVAAPPSAPAKRPVFNFSYDE